MDEEYIAIPKDEYEFLLYCKQQLIDIHNAEIQKLHNEIQGQQINTEQTSQLNLL